MSTKNKKMTSEELFARAKELLEEARKAKEDAKKMKAIEDQKAREEAERQEMAFLREHAGDLNFYLEHQKEIQFNEAIVEFAKTLPTNTNGVSLYDYIVNKMKISQANSSATARSDDRNSASAD